MDNKAKLTNIENLLLEFFSSEDDDTYIKIANITEEWYNLDWFYCIRLVDNIPIKCIINYKSFVLWCIDNNKFIT